jgi:trans-aconitate methyltransferase
MDRKTLSAYDAAAAAFARDWHAQPAPADLHVIVKRFFRPGRSADIGCGSGREVAWLVTNGFEAEGYDGSEALIEEARRRYPALAFKTALCPR